MLEYEVTNRAGLIAAVNAAAQATFEAAKANPVRITWGRCAHRCARVADNNDFEEVSDV